jgi:flagellar basal body rod protein FlgG
MERALWSSVPEMNAQSLSLDTIRHNLANISRRQQSQQIRFQIFCTRS